MRARTLAALVAALLTLAVGCGSGEAPDPGRPSDRRIEVGYVERDESVALANLTKVLLERAGRENVELEPAEIGSVFRQVAEGELDVYQGVWLPNQERALEEAGDGVKLLNPWLIGTTRSSLAVPAYMQVRSLEALDSTEARRALGVHPEASAVAAEVPGEVFSRYGLERDFDYPSAAAMLEEVDRLYEEKEPFVFLAWTPHWMNLEYEFNYLEDPEGVLPDLTRPARLHPVVHRGFEEEDPLAYALVDTILMTEYQATELQSAIREAGDPEKGASAWVEDHRRLTRGWIKTAKTKSSEKD